MDILWRRLLVLWDRYIPYKCLVLLAWHGENTILDVRSPMLKTPYLVHCSCVTEFMKSARYMKLLTWTSGDSFSATVLGTRAIARFERTSLRTAGLRGLRLAPAQFVLMCHWLPMFYACIQTDRPQITARLWVFSANVNLRWFSLLKAYTRIYLARTKNRNAKKRLRPRFKPRSSSPFLSSTKWHFATLVEILTSQYCSNILTDVHSYTLIFDPKSETFWRGHCSDKLQDMAVGEPCFFRK